MKIPAISIRQPWAELIIRGKKTLEVRSWSTDYRGQLWLHTGKRGDPFNEEKYHLVNLFKGGYIGFAFLEGVFPLDPERWQNWRPKHLVDGPYRLGLYAWLLSHPKKFVSPLPAQGALRLFLPTDEDFILLSKADFIQSITHPAP